MTRVTSDVGNVDSMLFENKAIMKRFSLIKSPQPMHMLKSHGYAQSQPKLQEFHGEPDYFHMPTSSAVNDNYI